MAEIIDIVNENDEVVGQATKDDAHLKRLPHRIGTVYIFYKGKLLVQGRSLEKDGLLDHSSAGHVHTGESYADAAAREMFEEVGIRGSLKYVGTVSSERERGDNSRFRHWFGLFEIELSDAVHLLLGVLIF
jgi:isopentenyldiphosphate isomerase